MTGYCQGDFCRTRVVALMEREYGNTVSPMTDVEMRGDARVTRVGLVEYIAGLGETDKNRAGYEQYALVVAIGEK